MSACQTTDQNRAKKAGARLGQAAADAAPYPLLPPDCLRRERSNVRLGDPLDVALIKSDQALGRANARVHRCAHWHEEFRRQLFGEQAS